MDNQPCQRETDEYRCTAKEVCYSGVDIHCLDGKRCPFLVIKAEQPHTCPECGHPMSEHKKGIVDDFRPILTCYHNDSAGKLDCMCATYPADQEQKHCMAVDSACYSLHSKGKCGGIDLNKKPCEYWQPEQPTPMPLVELQKQLRDEIQSCRDYDDSDEKTTKHLMVRIEAWLPAHDAAIRAQAVKEFALKLIATMPEEYEDGDDNDGVYRQLKACIAHIRAKGGIE